MVRERLCGRAIRRVEPAFLGGLTAFGLSFAASAGLRAQEPPNACSDSETKVFGYVYDDGSGVRLPTARVRAFPGPGGKKAAEVRADMDGMFHFCGLPEGKPVVLQPEVGKVVGESREVVVAAGFPAIVHLRLALGTGESTSLAGWVTDAESGKPVGNATITVRPEGLRAITNKLGFFSIPELDAGPTVLEVEHLGYAIFRDTVTLSRQGSNELRVLLSAEAIPIEPITVSVRGRRWFGDMVDIQWRMDRGLGHFFTREYIEERGSPAIHHLLDEVPGLKMRKRGPGWFPVNRRQFDCILPVFVDGVRFRLDEVGLLAVHGLDVEVIEVYTGPAELPGEFGGSDARCGAVVIWTRR